MRFRFGSRLTSHGSGEPSQMVPSLVSKLRWSMVESCSNRTRWWIFQPATIDGRRVNHLSHSYFPKVSPWMVKSWSTSPYNPIKSQNFHLFHGWIMLNPLVPNLPWVSEISKNYIFSDLLNSTNLLYFFVPENLPKRAPKNGPKFHVLFVS